MQENAGGFAPSSMVPSSACDYDLDDKININLENIGIKDRLLFDQINRKGDGVEETQINEAYPDTVLESMVGMRN